LSRTAAASEKSVGLDADETVEAVVGIVVVLIVQLSVWWKRLQIDGKWSNDLFRQPLAA
jgi:hypothetical protein